MSNFRIVNPVDEDTFDIDVSLRNIRLETPAKSLTDEINSFVKENNPQVALLTPCYGGLCHTNYIPCLMETIQVLQSFGIRVVHHLCRNDSLITRARNNLIAKAMSDPKTTHFMFIDSDISWNAFDIIKLLVSEENLVGGVYPLKRYDWSKLFIDPQNPYNTNIIQKIIKKKENLSLPCAQFTDEKLLRCNIVKYNINSLDGTLTISKNIAKVRHLATGFMMMKRELITKMQLFYSSTKYVDDIGFLSGEENNFAYALFDCAVKDGHYLSEDWLFCDRWRNMGGDVFIDVSIDLTHTGIEDFEGSYITSIV